MKCDDCCLDVPDYARECPRCGKVTAWGREVRREWVLKVIFGVAGLAVLVGIIYAIVTEPQRHPMAKERGEPESASSPAPWSQPELGYAAGGWDGTVPPERAG